MSSAAFLLGVFLIPLAMLASCNRFKRLSAAQRRAVWGLIIGYGIAVTTVLAATLSPPVMWAADQPLRDFVVHWGLLLIPLLGVLVASLLPRQDL